MKNCSGKFLRKALDANLCKVNGKVERFGSRELHPGDTVDLAPNWERLLEKSDQKIEIAYEDDFFKIIVKPAGFTCTDDEVRKIFGPRHFLVHRLDKPTTGLLILAKSLEVKGEMIELFADKRVQKGYLALIDGHPKVMRGVIENRLGKKGSFEGQTIWGSVSNGQSAMTRWKVLEKGKNASLVFCEPITGRTHQIRVHMAEMNHPILVDRQYAKRFRASVFAPRVMLHAYELCFTFRGKEIHLTAKIPDDFREVMRALSIEMRELGEFFGKETEENSRNHRDKDENREEVEERAHLVDKTRKHPAAIKRNANARVPEPDAHRLKSGRSKPGKHRKPNRRK